MGAWLFLAKPLFAGWSDAESGLPLVTAFSPEKLGAPGEVYQLLQLADGRILAGTSNGLLIYDGLAWRQLAKGRTVSFLTQLADGRIAWGGVNDFGFVHLAAPPPVLESWFERLPPEARDLNVVWGAGQVGDAVYFVSQSKLLGWDGTRMTVRDFPTKTRLVPLHFEGALWFTHPETGLYRLEANGPRLEYPATALPDRPTFWLERTGTNLEVAGSNGFFPAGEPKRLRCSEEAAAFLQNGVLTSVLRLPDGTRLLGTLNSGIGVLDTAGRLLRVLDRDHGLPGNSISQLLLDREGRVWVAALGFGIFSFEARGAASVFREAEGSVMENVNGLAEGPDGLLAATDQGFFRAASGVEHGRGGFVRLPLPAATGRIQAVTVAGNQVVLTHYAEISRWRNGALESLHKQLSTFFYQIAASRYYPDRLYAEQNGALISLDPQPDGSWSHHVLAAPAEVVNGFKEDLRGQLWLETLRDGVFHLDPTSGKITPVVRLAASDNQRDHSVVAGMVAGEQMLMFVGAEAWVAALAEPTSARLALKLPLASVVRAVVSPDGRKAYIVFTRTNPDNTESLGLGVLSWDESGHAVDWRELACSELVAVGAVRCALLRSEADGFALWLGGSQGLLRIRPDELSPLAAPAAPELRLTTKAALAAGRDGLPELPFAGHRLSIHVHTPEISAADRRWIQTRLRARDAWSEPVSTRDFAFSNLSEGTYTFAARAVNMAGVAGPEVSLRFRILPPWWRTPWAYLGYAAAALFTLLGVVRWRERRIRARNEELEQTVALRTAELRRANAAKDEFLAGISHEIRNPLNGVVALAESIEPAAMPPVARQRFAYLQQCAVHLSGLLENILDYAKIEAGAITLEPRPFSLVEFARSIEAMVATESARAGLPVSAAVSPGVPEWVEGDAARLRQVVLNFVLNALRYAGRGEVLLTIWGHAAEDGRTQITFAVSDDGPGISVEEQARLFTRFTRGAAADRTRASGSGLGLAVCRDLAEKMGGRIWVESELGKGATFHFSVTLPQAAPPAPTVAAETPERVRRALLVDDEDYNNVALAALVEPLGFSTLAVRDGVAALAAAKQEKFDAVFLDYGLPGWSGPELAQMLRRLPGWENGPVLIAVTAYTTPDRHAGCLAAGMDAVLTKPMTGEKLRSALKQVAATGEKMPAREAAPDSPLVVLRWLADRKGIAVKEELALFFQETDREVSELVAEMAQRHGDLAARAAHKLAGRLGFVRTRESAEQLLELERVLQRGEWLQAEQIWRETQPQLHALHERLKAAAD